jgi:hypothetical protein
MRPPSNSDEPRGYRYQQAKTLSKNKVPTKIIGFIRSYQKIHPMVFKTAA